MALRRDERGEATGGLSRAQTLDLCARLASYSEADATPRELLERVGREAAARFPEDAEVLVAIGRMFLCGDELDEAERVLRRAVLLAPQDPPALRLLGEVLLRKGDPASAHAALSSAVACGMSDPWTKTWVARALDYSELLDDLGRDGIARDVRQVLGKPGQGPPDDDRRLAELRRAEPLPRRIGKRGVIGRIDKGVFFAGDARAEPPELRAPPSSSEIVDLPTPAPAEVQRAAATTGKRTSAPGDVRAATTGKRTSTPGDAGAATTRLAGRAKSPPSSPDLGIEKLLADDAAWSAPSTPTSAPGSAPRSEPGPPSDTEISAWVPDMEALGRGRRSAPPVNVRGSSPPAAPNAPPPGMQRLSAAELYDEFTDHKRPVQSIHALVEAAKAEKARRTSAPEGDRGTPLPDAQPPERWSPVPPERASAVPAEDRVTAVPVRPRTAPPPLPPEDRSVAAVRAGPPPLPPDFPDDRPTLPCDSSIFAATGQSAALPDDWTPRVRGQEAPAITVLGADDHGPVTAPPSALIPYDGPVTAPPSALIPLDETLPHETAPSARASSREPSPPTAPPSALLPPEPPSLQIPSKVLTGGLKPPPPEAPKPLAAAPERKSVAPERKSAAPAEAPAKPKPKPRSRLQVIGLRALAALVVAGVLAGGFELYKRNRSTRMRTFAAQAAIALHAGGPHGVADAEAALANAKRIEPKSRSVALGIVRARFFAVIDVDPARAADLTSAMKDAKDLGASSADLAFAEIASHVAAGDTGSAVEAITNHDEDADRAGDALYQLAAGVALEPQDPTAAIERYRAAVKADPDLLSAEIRLTRALAFAERAGEANERLSALLLKWPGRSETNVLAAIVAASDPSRASKASIDPGADADMLPRALRAAARVLAKGNDEQAVSKAIAEADVAPLIVLCGEAALRMGNDASAREAAQHAIELSPSFAPAYSLVARVALSSGRFEEARQAALRSPPDVSAEVLSFIAYEAGDVAAMATAAGRRADGEPGEPIPAGLARLRGAEPLSAPTISLLARSGRFWADVIAMDAALDAGDLAAAQQIATAWSGGDKHPIRSYRVARLLRYQGKNGLAQTAAASAAPTLAARIESALASAEMASARDAAVSALGAGRTPEERWTLTFLLAREGRAEAAHAAMNSVEVPGGDAPLLLRTVAALALGELHTTNPSSPLSASLGVWTKNPDVARALGVAVPTEAPAGSGAATDGAPPPKPVLKGKIPRNDEDPY